MKLVSFNQFRLTLTGTTLQELRFTFQRRSKQATSQILPASQINQGRIMQQQQVDLEAILNQRNLRKQYSQLNELIPQYAPSEILRIKKSILLDLFNSCFDDNLLIGAAALERFLKKLYAEFGPEDPKLPPLYLQQYVDIIFPSYFQSVTENANNYNLNYSQQIHRVLHDVKPESLIHILQRVLAPGYQEHKVRLWAAASLLRWLKQSGLLDITGLFQFKEPLKLDIDPKIVQSWMFSCKRAIQFEAFQIFAVHSKSSALPSPLEQESVLLFIKHCLKTSYPSFRKNYLGKMKVFFERVRAGHQRDFRLIEKGKKPINDLGKLKQFVNECFDLLFQQLIPECCFEMSNPCLEILKLIYFFLGSEDEVKIKKGALRSQSSFLIGFCFESAFNEQRFESLMTQLSSNWESSRVLAYEILSLFPKELPYVGKERILQLQQLALKQIGSPVIRWYESGSFLYSWLMNKYAEAIYPTETPFYDCLKDFLKLLKERFVVFKAVFSVDIAGLQQNLIHGYICCFWVLLQRNRIQKILTQDQLKDFFVDLLELVREIIEFGTQVSSENVCTWIIDDKNIAQSPYAVDCRGHFYQAEFVQNLQKVLSGNTLIQSLDDQADTMSENVLVVSFFLITRESGVFFQELAKFIEVDEPVIPNDSLKRITYQFFHALLNIKHLGSIDRIAQGLHELCRTMCQSKKPQLPGLVDELIQRLIDAFDQNQLKNVFRRSAGLPHLVCCLLRSCDRKLKQKDQVLDLLINYAQNGALEMRIHALNVLRKLFMEAQLKLEMEKYITQGYILAIDGFSYDDWSVRNSSLMLFAALTARTLGKNTQNTEQIAQKITLPEFFQRSPMLIQYFHQKITSYDDSQLYPSLYPIALVLSRLAPMDGKFVRKVQTEPLGQQPEFSSNSKVDQKQIAELLPLLIKCLKNKNYLGRVIVSKTVLPFLKFDQIPEYVTNLFKGFDSASTVKKDHNNAHGLLLLCFQLLKDYYQIKRVTVDQYSPDQLKLLDEQEKKIVSEIPLFFVTEIRCPPVKAVLYQILIILMKNHSGPLELERFYRPTAEDIDAQFSKPNFRIERDMFHSVLRKKQLSFAVHYDTIYREKPNFRYLESLTCSLVRKYIDNPPLLETDDLEVLSLLYKYAGKSGFGSEKVEIAKLTYELLQQKLDTYMAPCIERALKLLLRISEQTEIASRPDILQKTIKDFHENGQIVKSCIKLLGYAFLREKNLLPDFIKLCELYSLSNNIDDLRVAVIKSIKIALPAIKLCDSLQLTLIYLRLLQDENPEIRNLIAKLLCQLLYGNNFTKRLNYEYLIDNFIHEVFAPFIKDPLQAAKILVSLLFDGEFYFIKKQNHNCKRIFQYEKSNKYASELKVRHIAFQGVLQLVKSRQVPKELVFQALEEYRLAQENQRVIEIGEQKIAEYKGDVTLRDEYLYENLIKYVIDQELRKQLKEDFQYEEAYVRHNVAQLESSFQLFVNAQN